MFQLINGFRQELGLPPFRYNATLAAAAQQQASYLANANIYSHTGSGGTSPQDRATGLGYQGFVVENIVGGTSMTAKQGLTWWINSPVHYNTLVSSRHVEAGVGYAFGNGQHRYTLVVGRPADTQAGGSGARREAQPAPLRIEPIILASPREDGSIVHTVGVGQALWSLAAYYDVPLSDLLLFNNLTEDSFLQPGDEITIRLAEGQAPPPTPTPPFTHMVRKGQTLWTIAAIYNLKLSDLLYFNGLSEGAFIQPGQELVIRLREGQLPPPTPTPQLTYVVEEGDTFWAIAIRYNLALEELLALNQLSETDLLQPGQELRIRRLEPTPFPPTFTPAPITPTPIRTPETPGQAAAAEPQDGIAVSRAAGPTATPPATREGSPAAEITGNAAGLTLLGSGAALLAILGIGLIWVSRRNRSEL